MTSRSTLGALLAEHLFARGCPVVSPADTNVPSSFERSAEFGRLLARFHEATGDFVPPEGSEWTRLSLRTLLGGDPGWIDRLFSHEPAEGSAWTRWWHAVTDRLARAPGSDVGMCHGEAYPATCRVVGQDLALAELDWAGEGDRVFDLATFRWVLAIHAEDRADELFGRFRDGYAAVRVVPDLSELEAWVAARHLWSLRLAAGFEEPAGLIRRGAFVARWVID